MLIRNVAKPALFVLAVCVAVGSGVGFKHLLGDIAPSPSGARTVEIELEDEDEHNGGGSGNSGTSSKCVLLLSQCPVTEPNCTREPLRIELSCTDPSCLASPQSCAPITSGSNSSSRASAASSAQHANSCMLRRFECSKESHSSCYKRWRTTSLNCTENICGTANCLRSNIFFATYKLEPWDTGSLPGPFPRTETMCIVQSSPCAPTDPSCLSTVSLEQVSCDDAKCIAGTCTRMSVLVDQNDTIVSNVASGTSGTSGKENEGEGKDKNEEKDVEEDKNENKGTGNANGTTNNGGTAVVETTKALGCFDENGQWTADRSKCASDQKKFVEPTAPSTTGQPQTQGTPEEQKVVERTIESQFVPDTRKSALAQNILSSTVEASGRIGRILENPLLPPDTRTALEQRLESLRATQSIVSANDQSVRDLQVLADSVSDDLNGVQQTVTQWMESSPHDFPVTVTDKLDRLFTALPSIFGILLQEGIPVESSTMDAYLVAQQTYDAVHAECLNNADSCGDLSKVLDALEPVYAGIRISLEKAGRIDLEQQIDSLLQ